VRRKPEALERYVDLLYRKKVRSTLAILRLNKLLTTEEFKMLVREERDSALARSITFFIIGFVAAYIMLHVLFAIGVAKADEPPKKVCMMGDSQAFLLAQDMPSMTPAGYAFGSSVAPGSSVISWALRNHARQWAELRRCKPDILLVVLGTNDAYMGPRIIRAEHPLLPLKRGDVPYLMWLMAKFERLSPNILWVGPPWLELRPSGVEHFQMMLSGMDGKRIKYLDSTMLALHFWEDKMHCDRLSQEGCPRWGRWIWQQVRDFQPADIEHPPLDPLAAQLPPPP